MRAAYLVMVLSLACFMMASLGYNLLYHTIGFAFGGLFRMFMYHEDHPHQYISLVSVVYGLMGTLWWKCLGQTRGLKRWLGILVTLVLVILVSSIPGGVLWEIHDMQAGYFPEGEMLWSKLGNGVTGGLMLGWLVMLVSFPYNLCGIILGAYVLHALPSRLCGQEQEKNP